MDTKEITTKYRLSQWTQVMQERQCSGQSIKDFCQEKGISKHAYFYWQRKLRKAACVELSKLGEHQPVNYAPEGWIQITQGQETKSTLDIEVSGCRISVNAETDSELLKKVCRILRVL